MNQTENNARQFDFGTYWPLPELPPKAAEAATDIGADEDEQDDFAFARGLIVAICITTCLAALGFTLSEFLP